MEESRMKTKQLKITAEIKKFFNDGGKVKAAASLVIDGVFVVRGVRLIDGSKGMFVSMPSYKGVDGEYVDICFPINNETRLQIFDAVTAAYEKALSGQNADNEAPDDEQESA
jgi:stage V sporulation protein G